MLETEATLPHLKLRHTLVKRALQPFNGWIQRFLGNILLLHGFGKSKLGSFRLLGLVCHRGTDDP